MSSELDSARKALDAAIARQQKIDALVATKQAALDKLAAERQSKGRGRPNTAHAAKKKAFENALARLHRGLLPEDPDPRSTAPRSADELRASAAQHPQHHAAAGIAPSGRPGGSSSGGSGAADATAGGSGANGGTDDDDDVCDASFHQFYKVSKVQRVFNDMIASEYQSGERDRRSTKVEPAELVGSGCDPNLGACRRRVRSDSSRGLRATRPRV